ncbi:MAG TPA: circadian clock KaiB family protein [Terracidiphilus sp.]|jgi:circadian clock protein KaiB
MTKIRIPKTIADALEKAPANERYLLRLYVSGVTERSRRSILNINTICKENLQGRYDLEVVDIHQKPSLAIDEQIVATPTLIKMLPLPLRRIVGDLSNKDGVLLGLDIKRRTDQPGSVTDSKPKP